MHLRTPLVTGIVALAAGFALLRACGRAAAPASFTATASAASGRAGPASTRAARPAPASAFVVYVAGEVARPGLYRLPPSARAADAVRAAGGASADADLVAVNLAAPVRDGDEVAVPVRAPAGTAARARNRRSRGAAVRHARTRHKHRSRAAVPDDGADAAGPPVAVDLNAAGVADLETLPGIGEALAGRIVAVRDQTGPFASPDDLLDVGGMTQSRLDAILPYVIVR